MNALSLQQISCIKTEDSDSTDELLLQVTVDGQLKANLRYSLPARKKWLLNNNYIFDNHVVLKLWEEDGAQRKLLLQLTTDLTDKAGEQEKIFHKDRARYLISYTLDKHTFAQPRPKIKRKKIKGKLRKAINQKPIVKKDIEPPKIKVSATKPPAINNELTLDAFLPSQHGFVFPNRFKLNLDMGLFFIPKIKTNYGLCGGMAMAAADAFYHNQHLPLESDIPTLGTKLYKYLVDRQLQSFGKNFYYLFKFFNWWLLFNDSQTQQRSVSELNKVKKHIDKGETVQLGLMYASYKTGSLWDNHQVLAYDYEENNNGMTYIKIYDPNFPKRNDIYLQTNSKTGKKGKKNLTLLTTKQHIPNLMTRHVRGFFAIPVKLQQLPEYLNSV